MNKFAFLTILYLNFISSAIAQTVFPQAIDIPITPNLAALYKFMDQPVGAFSGIPPVSFPVLDLNPHARISLNYNGGGIKVEEIASSVGLGWTLPVGGNVTRVMRGIPDDVPGSNLSGGYYHSTFKPSNFSSANSLVPAINAGRNLLDLEPDLYLYSFNGNSGSFFFDENKNIVMTEQNGISIDPVVDTDNGRFLGWIFRDEKGNKYYFGITADRTRSAVDFTEPSFTGKDPYTNAIPISVFRSTWHLVQADDINNVRLADYNYTSNTIFYESRGVEFRKLIITGQCTPNDGDNLSTIVNVKNEESSLNEIIFREGRIYLEYSERLDLIGGRKLDRIKLFNKANSLVRTFHFNYGYFSSGGGAGTQTSHLFKRLKLLSFSDHGSGLDSITHRFEYNEGGLPIRTSTNMDYWGYYNGPSHSNANTLIPNGTYFYSEVINYTQGADRRTKTGYNTACILSKVIYPTGAERRYFYEGNYVLNDPSSEILQDDDNSQFHNIYLDMLAPTDHPYSGYRQDITINSTTGSAKLGYYIIGDVRNNCGFNFRIVNKSTNSQVNQINQHWITLEEELYLPNGVYELQLDYFSPCSVDVLDLYWSENKVSQQFFERFGKSFLKDNELAGGLRIKKIEDYQPENNQVEITEYKYNLFNDSLLTSGLLLSSPKFFFTKTCAGRSCVVRGLSSQSCYPLTSQSGSYVFYTDVTTIRSKNGRIEQKFSFNYDGDLMGEDGRFSPITPVVNRSYSRGDLIFSKYYNDDKTLLKEVRNLYNYMDEYSYNPYHKKIIAYRVSLEGDDNGVGAPLLSGCWKPYYLQSQFKYLKSTSEVYYHGTDSICTSKEYFFNEDLAALYPHKETFRTSSNKALEINYRYAFDSSLSFGLGLTPPELLVKQELRNANYLQPIEVVNKVSDIGGSSFISGDKYIFDLSNFGHFNLSKQQHFYGLNEFVNQNYIQYDDMGNLLSEKIDGGNETCYIWGYGGTKLIARVRNVEYLLVESLLGESVAVKAFRDKLIPTPSEIKGFLAQLQQSNLLKDALIDTYVYDPLVGLVEQTDPKGMTTYYEYDSFQRLKNVKDQNGNIVKSYNYNYKLYTNH